MILYNIHDSNVHNKYKYFHLLFHKSRSQARKFRDLRSNKMIRGSVWRSALTYKIFWLIKRFLEPILSTRKTKWLLFSEKLWKSDSIYFNSRRWSQNGFKEFQKWVMFKVIHGSKGSNDLLTQVDLGSQTFGIRSEFLTCD